MNEIIKVNSENQTVSVRELQKVLEATERFNAWFQRYAVSFEDGVDYTTVNKLTEVQNNGGIQERMLVDYECSVDMAKHICLMSRTDKGKECRQYLIDLEKAWNTPEQIMARALKIANETIDNLKVTVASLQNEVVEMNNAIEEMQPKVSYLDKILNNPSTVLTTQIAQDYGMSAKAFNKMLHEYGVQHKVGGQWILYSQYQGNGYVHSHTHNFERADGRSDSKMNTEWRQKGRLFLYHFLKEQGILPLIELENIKEDNE